MADLKTTKQITAELEKQQKLLQNIDNNSTAYKNTQKEILRLQEQLSKAKQKEVKELTAEKPIYKQIESSIQNRLKKVKELSAQGSISSKIQNASVKSQGRLLQNIQDQVTWKGQLNDASTEQLKVVTALGGEQLDIADLNQKIAESEERVAAEKGTASRLTKDDEKALNNILKGEKNRLRAQKLSGMAREKGLQVADNLSGGMASKAKEFGAKMGMSPKNLARLGVAGLIIGVMVKAVTGFSKKIDAVGESFGFMTNKNKEFRNDLIQSGNNAMMIGKNLGDVLSVTSQLSSEFGITLKESKDIAGSVLDTAVATGISNDEATKLFGTFMQIGGLTAKQSERLIENTAQLAAQKGVAPVAVLQDMAGSAEEIAGFTKDGGKNIAEAAVQARQMGLSLSTTAKIAEGLLDFESSIANEMEASIMIGKQLNFQRARQLALEGDIAGATKNIVDQVGSEADFNALNVLQRQSLAKSIGVSVSEMAKLVKGSEKLTLSGALAGESFDDLVGQDSLSTLTSIVNTVKQIGATILDTFGGPLADMLSQFIGKNGLQNIKLQLVAIANIAIDSFNAGRDFLNTFRFRDVDLAKKFRVDDSGNIMRDVNPVNDFKSGPGQITHMTGPAGTFSLNPKDSVLATTNRINDFQTGPAGSMGGMGGMDAEAFGRAVAANIHLETKTTGGMDAEAFGRAVAANIHLETKTTHGEQRIIMNSAINPYGGHSMNPGK
jgi:hypothetical protein